MKLHLFGAAGEGVITLGRALGEHLSWPYFDADSYFWLPGPPTPSTALGRAPRLEADLARQSCAIEGSIGG